MDCPYYHQCVLDMYLTIGILTTILLKFFKLVQNKIIIQSIKLTFIHRLVL